MLVRTHSRYGTSTGVPWDAGATPGPFRRLSFSRCPATAGSNPGE